MPNESVSRLLGVEKEHTLVLCLTCLLLGGGVMVGGIGKVVLQKLLGAEDSLAPFGEWTKASSNTDPLVSRVASNMGQPIEDRVTRCTGLVSVPRPHVKTSEGSGHQAYPDVSPYAGMLAYR